MNVSREAVAAALFTQLAGTKIGGVSPFNTTGRRARIWSDLSPGDQPAMFLIHTGEQAVQNQAPGLTKWMLHFEVLIYARVDPSPSSTPDTFINAILDALDAQMQTTPPGERQTLGGVIYNAWIEGQIFIDTGILDQQIAILVPIRVMTGI
jgi:hypothetical protein